MDRISTLPIQCLVVALPVADGKFLHTEGMILCSTGFGADCPHQVCNMPGPAPVVTVQDTENNAGAIGIATSRGISGVYLQGRERHGSDVDRQLQQLADVVAGIRPDQGANGAMRQLLIWLLANMLRREIRLLDLTGTVSDATAAPELVCSVSRGYDGADLAEDNFGQARSPLLIGLVGGNETNRRGYYTVAPGTDRQRLSWRRLTEDDGRATVRNLLHAVFAAEYAREQDYVPGNDGDSLVAMAVPAEKLLKPGLRSVQTLTVGPEPGIRLPCKPEIGTDTPLTAIVILHSLRAFVNGNMDVQDYVCSCPPCSLFPLGDICGLAAGLFHAGTER